MIRLVEALNYRCLRYVRRPLGDFHVLVGPNASGKSTFLDVVAFLRDLVSEGLEAAVDARSQNFQDLVWGRSGAAFELAVESEIPEDRRLLLPEGPDHRLVRYELRLGVDEDTDEVAILAEKVVLRPDGKRLDRRKQTSLFPEERQAPATIMSPSRSRGAKTVVNKVPGGNDNFYDETGKGWDHAFKLGPRKSALANLPEDETRFPVATWLKGVLMTGVQRLVLNSALMRRPSPPGQPRAFRADGSNMPWVVKELATKHEARFREWIDHLRTALRDLVDIRVVERPEDRTRYLVARYDTGLEVPSWMMSDGSLRLFALTLLAYLPELRGVYLIEEPENGIHPQAVETAFQSLSSVYDAQVLMATHSPVILSVAEAQQVLCFAKTPDGAADVVSGDEHPKLRDWKGEVNLGVLFAGGVLG